MHNVPHMSEEIFDIVDLKDQVIGQEKRSKVHAEKLLHRAVHILVFNRDNELFLQKRSMTKDLCPGLWSTSCAGHLDSGEDYDSAAHREFAEEMGIEAPTLQRLFKIDACADTGNEFVWVYLCHHDGPFNLCEEEIETGAWLKHEEFERLMRENPAEYTPALKAIWALYKKAIDLGENV